MFCRFCGASIPDDSMFCEKCGEQLSNESTPQEALPPKKESESGTIPTCRICGAELSPNDSGDVCINCRLSLDIYEDDCYSAPVVTHQRESFFGSTASLILLMAVIVIGSIVIMFASFSQTDLNNHPREVSTISVESGLMESYYSLISDREASAISDNDPLMTYAEYTSIATGMSYDEVVEIVGSYGRELSRVTSNGYEIVMIGWYGKGSVGANANITFENGKVISKAQVGLE